MVKVYIGPFQDAKAGSRILLRRALADLGFPETELLHDGRGRPYLASGPQISLSHTTRWAAAAVSDGPVGVDLEADRRVSPKLPPRILSESELAWYRERGEHLADLLTLWTLKESWYKYLGTGLPGFPNGTEFYPEDGRWRLRGADACFTVYKKDLLTAAVCAGDQEVEFICF